MRLQGKVAVVTGAGSGFGAGIARLFAAEGGRVVLADIDGAAAETVAAEIDRAGGAALGIAADVTRRDQVAAMMRAALDTYGRLDVLVNNAGVAHRNKPMTEVTEDELDRIFAVNVKAIYLAALEAIPLLRAQGGGCIINTSSTAALRPRPGLTVYNSSKGAVNVMTKSGRPHRAGRDGAGVQLRHRHDRRRRASVRGACGAVVTRCGRKRHNDRRDRHAQARQRGCRLFRQSRPDLVKRWRGAASPS
jgi:NAD(P)-dependent dehydrogenase (short-subunit alcohol dehydrogenase family)